MKTSEVISTFRYFIGLSEVLKIIFLTSDIRVMIMRHKFEVIQGGLSVAELQPLGGQLSYFLQLQVRDQSLLLAYVQEQFLRLFLWFAQE